MAVILLLLVQIPLISADDFEIIDTDYKVDESKSDNTKQYYTIFITMKNNKFSTSENIIIELLDEWEIPTKKIYNFEPNESKTFVFENIPFAGGNVHQVRINYYPENESIQTPENTGSTIFNISYQNNETETPFLHPLAMILTIMVIALMVKKYNIKQS